LTIDGDARPLDLRSSARTEFIDIKRLDQVVIRPAIEAGYTIRDGIPGSQYQHRHITLSRTKRFEEIHSGETGQVQIQQQQVENFILQRMVGYPAIRQPVDCIAILDEAGLNPLP
jgi:hypothetical protein